MNEYILPQSGGEVAKALEIVLALSSGAMRTEFALSSSDEGICTTVPWVTPQSRVAARMRSCAYGNGTFVDVGLSGAVQISKDAGKNWTAVTAFTSHDLICVAYGYGKFVCGSFNGEIFTSEDGEDWTQIDATLPATPNAAIFAKGKFIFVGVDGMVAVSADGEAFTVLEAFTTGEMTALTHSEDHILSACASGEIWASANGEEWVNCTVEGDTKNYRAATYGEGRFVLGANGGAITYSDDGTTWNSATTSSTSTISYIRGLAYADGVYYAVMYTTAGGGEVWKSTDGENWTVVHTTADRLWCVCIAESTVIASGDNGRLCVLDASIAWSDKEPFVEVGEYLWERTAIHLPSGGVVASEPVCRVNISALHKAVSILAEAANMDIDGEVNAITYHANATTINSQTVQ